MVNADEKGFFIKRKNGGTHVLSGKLVCVASNHLLHLFRYLDMSHGVITLEAKRVFEFGEISDIEEFITQYERTKHIKFSLKE